MRVVRGGLALLFLFSAAVQWNDPDPVAWIAIYAAATLACAVAAAGRPQPWLDGAVGLVSLAWAMTLAPAFTRTTLGDAFGHIGMVDLDAEEAREAIGLLIVAVAHLPPAARAIVARRSSSRR